MIDRILIVDDEPLVLEVLRDVLTSEGFTVSQASKAELALEMLAREPHALVLCDIRMPGMDGFELLRAVRRSHPGTDVIMMTGFGSLDGAIDAMALGAADYLIKPLKPKEIVTRLRAILHRRGLEAEVHVLQNELRSRYEIKNLVASSPRMAGVVSALNHMAQSDEPVVIHGEAGTGRRFVGRTVHYGSRRRGGPFAALACDASSSSDLETAIFGRREEGKRLRRGQLERSSTGTLHLFHLEHMVPDLQRRIAGALACGNYNRVNDLEPMPLETRLLFSTDAPPAELLASGRLVPEFAALRDAITLHIPSLKNRREDIPGLVAGFFEEHAAENGTTLRIEPQAVELLGDHEYPGNVGQLFAVLRHSVNLSLSGVVTAEVIRRSLRQVSFAVDTSAPQAIAAQLGDREHELVLRAVQRNPGQLDEAARELGVSRTTLWRRMRKYGITISS